MTDDCAEGRRLRAAALGVELAYHQRGRIRSVVRDCRAFENNRPGRDAEKELFCHILASPKRNGAGGRLRSVD